MILNSIDFEIFDHLPIGICIIDLNYIIIFWNYTLQNYTNIKKSEITGKNIIEIFPRFSEVKYQSRINEIFKGGPPIIFSSQIHKYLFPAILVNGESRIQHNTVSPIPTEITGEYLAMFSV